MSRRWAMGMLVVCLCSLPASSSAQLPVTDAGNLLANTAQLSQAVLMVINMGLELAGIGGIDVGSEYNEDLRQITALASDAQALGADIASLNAQINTLFDIHNTPGTSTELRVRIHAMRTAVWEAQVTALRTQTLVRTALNTVKHLTSLIGRVAALTGNMGANQVMIQLQSKLNQTLVNLQVQTAAHQRAETLDRLQEAMILRSLQTINSAAWTDHPGIVR
jgi:hypothetical protein